MGVVDPRWVSAALAISPHKKYPFREVFIDNVSQGLTSIIFILPLPALQTAGSAGMEDILKKDPTKIGWVIFPHLCLSTPPLLRPPLPRRTGGTGTMIGMSRNANGRLSCCKGRALNFFVTKPPGIVVRLESKEFPLVLYFHWCLFKNVHLQERVYAHLYALSLIVSHQSSDMGDVHLLVRDRKPIR